MSLLIRRDDEGQVLRSVDERPGVVVLAYFDGLLTFAISTDWLPAK